jgi:hypothetical protein
MDVVTPTVSETLSYFVRENTVFVILLFVLLLVLAVSVVNILVLKRNAKKQPEQSDRSDSGGTQ